MKKALILIFVMVSLGDLISQIQLPNHTIYSCDFIVLDEIDGDGLSDNLYYYEGALADDLIFMSGDTIHSSKQLFAYDAINGWEECLIINIIENIPIINMEDTIWLCNIGVLPKPAGEFITINARYYKTNEYSDPPLYPGSTIEEEGWYYLRDGYENCYVFDSVFMRISPLVFIDEIMDTFVCKEYIIPDFSAFTNGIDLSFQDNIGESYLEGDTVKETVLLTMTSKNEVCSETRVFQVSVFDGVFEDLEDTLYCGNGVSFNPFGNYSVLPGFDSSYIEISNGAFSSTFIADYKFGDSGCTYKDSVTVMDGGIGSFPWSIPDTSYLCNIGEIDLIDYASHYKISPVNSAFEFEFYAENGDQISDKLDSQDLINDTICIYIHIISIPECFDSSHIFKSTIIVQEDCWLKDLRDTFHCGIPGTIWVRNLEEVPYGARMYDSMFNAPAHYTDVEYGSNIFYYIIQYADGTRDTATHLVQFYEGFEIYPTQYDYGSICYGDCFTIPFVGIDSSWLGVDTSFEGIDTNTYFLFWGFELYSATNDEFIGTSFSGINEFPEVCFIEGLLSNFDITYVDFENHDYYLVFYNDFIINNKCINNDITDTVYFSTLFNTSRYINDVLCPNEELVIEEDTFNIQKPYGEVIIENSNSNGCDSIIIVDLEFDITAYRNIEEHYCDTSQYVFAGCERFDYSNSEGIVTIENGSSNGCDSIVEIKLNFVLQSVISDTMRFCEGDTIFFNNTFITEDYFYSDTIRSNFECDSVIINNVFRILDTPDNVTIDPLFDCESRSYDIQIIGDYSFLHVDNYEVNNGLIEDFTEEEIMLHFGYDNECPISSTFQLPLPEEWTVKLEEYQNLILADEIVLTFESNLVDPIITWEPAELLSCHDCDSPTLLHNIDTTIILRLTDEFGCSKVDSIAIRFQNENEIYVPNVINPSSKSEKNRSFHVISKSQTSYDLIVFDRWGSEVYSAKNISSNEPQIGWIPEANLELGVYVYLIHLYDKTLGDKLAGSVLLLK